MFSPIWYCIAVVRGHWLPLPYRSGTSAVFWVVMQLYWSAVPASIAAVTASIAAVTADDAAAKICFHIGHVNQQVTASWERHAVAKKRYRFLGSGYRFPKKRFSSGTNLNIWNACCNTASINRFGWSGIPLHHRCRAAHLHKSSDVHRFLEAVFTASWKRFSPVLRSGRAVVLQRSPLLGEQ